jgi:hypothetical protein
MASKFVNVKVMRVEPEKFELRGWLKMISVARIILTVSMPSVVAMHPLEISGRVLDHAGAGVSDKIVTIFNSKIKIANVISDSSGWYKISLTFPAKGTYVLRSVCSGVASKEMSIACS